MIEVKATGMFDRTPEVRTIERAGKNDLQLGVGSLSWSVQRGDREVRMWIDVEAVGEKAWELADIPVNMEVTVTGTLERNSWKNKQTDQWQSKHVIKFQSADVGAVPEPVQDDIPF